MIDQFECKYYRQLCFPSLIGSLLVFTAGGVLAQNSVLTIGPHAPVVSMPYTPTLTFDVASVKESKPAYSFTVGGPNPLHSSLFQESNLFAMQLIQLAYGVDFVQISGGPAWLNSTRYDVQAKSDPSVDNVLARLNDDQAKLEKQHMLQVLLAARFKLEVHVETKMLPVYELSVAKNGPKFRQTSSTASNAGKDTVSDGVKMAPLYQRNDDERGYNMIAHGSSMKLLAERLSLLLHTPVLDETGLSGVYDFTLQFHGKLSDMEIDNGSKWPPAETAVQEQLGLKLKVTTGPREIVVIDHVEKPSVD